MAQTKIVVFTGALNYSVTKGIVEIDRAIPELRWLVVLSTPQKRARTLLRNQVKNLGRNGWRWIPYQAKSIWAQLLNRRHHDLRSNGPGHEYQVASLIKQTNVRILNVHDIHAEATIQAVRDFGPDLGLSLAAPILRQTLFSIPALGTLNLHKGAVPDYRGMPPAFWELWNDETCVGCTIHLVDEKLDRGPVILETKIARDQFSTVRGLQLRLDEVGVRLMRDAVRDRLAGKNTEKTQSGEGYTYRKPTLLQEARLQQKLNSTQASGTPMPKRLLKETALFGGLAAWKLGLPRLLSPRITVLLYHRVSDDARDNLTVGIEQFERQMALLSKYCRVLGIEEVVATANISECEKPQVCVTFDDGYFDNYEHAAKILLRYGIPAAFFVSTGLIGTARVFPHDFRRGNKRIALMDWRHLKEMKDWGFTIGSHTVNHIDCASESFDAVEQELKKSLVDLRHHIGIRDAIFAYPYGGRKHMTQERLELVKQAGYIGCLSAYGGSNVATVNAFNVCRRGIHWEFSDNAFLFAALGLA